MKYAHFVFPLAAASSLAFADSTQPTDVQPRCVSYQVFGSVLYLQPNGSELTYGVEAIGLDPNIAVPALSPNWKILEIDPDYNFGFDIGARMLCNKSKISLGIDWERLHTSDSKTFTAPAADGFMVGPMFDIGPNSEPYKVAKGKATTNYDQVNLDLGKNFWSRNQLHANIYGGMAFARIKETLKSSFANTENTISRSIYSPSLFIGAGPQVGADYDFRIVDNFFFDGSSTITLFLGKMTNKTVFRTFTPELATFDIPQPNVQHTHVSNRTQLVPGFEQSIGFSYIAEAKRWKVSLGVGYRFQIYLDAVQKVDMTAPQVIPSGAIFTPEVGVFAVGFERTLSNFILSGPYATACIEF